MSVDRSQTSIKALAYQLAGNGGQYAYSRAKFALGLRPTVRPEAPHWSWPESRRAAVVFSADFELGWAWRYARTADPSALTRQKARQDRLNHSKLLALFDRYNVQSPGRLSATSSSNAATAPMRRYRDRHILSMPNGGSRLATGSMPIRGGIGLMLLTGVPPI